MGDFSFRAVDVLKSVAVVLAEDTRHTRHLLDRYDISTPATPYHEHNEAKTTPRLVARLLARRVARPRVRRGHAARCPIPARGSCARRSTRASTSSRFPAPSARARGARRVRSRRRPVSSSSDSSRDRGATGARRSTRFVDSSAHGRGVRIAQPPGGHSRRARGAAVAALRPAVVAREMTKQFEKIRRGTVTRAPRVLSGTARAR